MIGELGAEFERLAATDVRVVVLRGQGASFSAGADVNWMRASLDYSPDENIVDARRMWDMFATIAAFPAPVICRVHGAALGGGMGLMAVCDVVVAARETTFGFTEAKLGIIPAVISSFVLPKIGESWARALFLTAERFGPELARHIGLVHWICAADELDLTVENKVGEMLASGPEAAREAKKLIAAGRRRHADELREYTSETIATLRAGAEGQEGLKAFLEKRAPTWRNVP
jgi:methylglutaconyl-CoA hydratase